MPLTMARTGDVSTIIRITGKDEAKSFLNRLGFLEGERVTVVSEIAGNLIVSIKDTRVALDKSMASRIIV